MSSLKYLTTLVIGTSLVIRAALIPRGDFWFVGAVVPASPVGANLIYYVLISLGSLLRSHDLLVCFTALVRRGTSLCLFGGVLAASLVPCDNARLIGTVVSASAIRAVFVCSMSVIVVCL